MTEQRYLRAYYHEFVPTGVDHIDAILEAIALAGKAYHSTEAWDEAEEYGPCGYWSLIQQRANEAATHVQAETNAEKPVAWGEEIDGKIVSVRLDKSRHCTVPLYPAPQPSGTVEALADALRGLLKAYENAFDWTAELPPETAEAERIANEVLEALTAGKPERECATEGCCNPATVHFERGGVGSHYCCACYLKVQAVATPSTEGGGE